MRRLLPSLPLTLSPALTSSLFAALLLAGCSFTPKYERPAAPVPAQWPTPLAVHGEGNPDLAADRIGWADFFQSPQLRDIVSLAIANNRDLRVAVANVEAYRAQYRIQHADLLPSVSAGASGTIQRQPADVSVTGNNHVQHQAGVTAGVTSYELDLFGRVHSLNASALQSWLATDETRRGVMIALVANIGTSFLTLETDRARLKVAEQTAQNYQAALGLVAHALAAGTATQLDMHQARTALAGALADVERSSRLVATDLDALQLLVGAPLPQGFDDGFDLEAPPLARVTAGLPADLLMRRPDILEAEHRLISSNANIGAARAAFFPRITLTGSGGTASSEVSRLFAGGQGVWSFAPQISLPIFSGGRLKGNLDYARAQRMIELADYEKAIQTAFREVADGLAARATYGQQLDAQRAQVAEAEAYLHLAERSYTAGIQNYTTVLDAQRTVFSAKEQMLVDQLAQRTSEVILYKALGGGWQEHVDQARP